MDKQTLYTLPLKSLSIGNTQFSYTLENDFFQSIEESEIKVASIQAEVIVEKTALNIELSFLVHGFVEVPCDRCLDPMVQNIESEQHIIVKFGEAYSEESDELIVIPETEGTFNIAWLLYEFVVLAIPITHYHVEGECNEAMIETYNKLKVFSVDDIDTNDEHVVEKENNKADPRWDALKNIFDNN